DPDVVDVELPSEGRVQQSFVPGALPGVVDHDIEDDLHRAVLYRGSVAIELGALDAVDVPRDVVGLPVYRKAMKVGGVVLNGAGSIVADTAVDRERSAPVVVVICHEHRRRVMAEMLENVDLGAVGVGRVGGKHPERGEEALRSDQLQARLDIAVGEFVEIVGAVVRTWSSGG